MKLLLGVASRYVVAKSKALLARVCNLYLYCLFARTTNLC